MTCIYKITSPTDKIYIGQTTDFGRRTKSYRLTHCKAQTKLYNSLKKHGWDNHKAEILFELREDINPEMLTYWEQFFMDYYKGLGYNLLNIREAGPRGKMSQESKAKMSVAWLDRKISNETRQKMRNSHLGKKLSAEVKRKLSGENNHMFGKKHTETTKQKNREWHLGKKHSLRTKRKQSELVRGENNPRFKGFILVYSGDTFVGRYEGCKDAAAKLGISIRSVWRGLSRNKVLPRLGYKFSREAR